MRAALVISLASATAQAETAPIIGGTATKAGDFPTVVAIQVGQGLCTGTLVDPEWILTAAHCLRPDLVGTPDLPSLVKSIRVFFGSVDVVHTAGVIRNASEVFGDPMFDISDLGHSDIGLIHMSSSYDDADPTPVNFDHDKAPVGLAVTMVGFGATQGGNPQTAGAEFVLTGQMSEPCANVPDLGLTHPPSDDNLLCFDQSMGKGKCEGDSGGPSFAMIDGALTIVGTTSFGDKPCQVVGVDTRTDAEHDFLVGKLPSLEGGGGGCCDAGGGGTPTAGLALAVAFGLRRRRR